MTTAIHHNTRRLFRLVQLLLLMPQLGRFRLCALPRQHGKLRLLLNFLLLVVPLLVNFGLPTLPQEEQCQAVT